MHQNINTIDQLTYNITQSNSHNTSPPFDINQNNNLQLQYSVAKQIHQIVDQQAIQNNTGCRINDQNSRQFAISRNKLLEKQQYQQQNIGFAEQIQSMPIINIKNVQRTKQVEQNLALTELHNTQNVIITRQSNNRDLDDKIERNYIVKQYFKIQQHQQKSVIQDFKQKQEVRYQIKVTQQIIVKKQEQDEKENKQKVQDKKGIQLDKNNYQAVDNNYKIQSKQKFEQKFTAENDIDSENIQKIGNQVEGEQLLLNQLQQNCFTGYLMKSKSHGNLPILKLQNSPKKDMKMVIKAIEQIKNYECHRHQSNIKTNIHHSPKLGRKKRKLQLVCLDCKEIVCDYCVIFGDKNKQGHKLHKVISVDQFIKDAQQLQQCISVTIPQKPHTANQVKKKITHPLLFSQFSQKKQQIHNKFTLLIHKLKEQQQQLYQQLQQQYIEIQTKIYQQQNKQYKHKYQIKKYIIQVLQNCYDIIQFQNLFGKQSYIYKERLNQKEDFKINRVNKIVKKIYQSSNNKASAKQLIHILQENKPNHAIQKHLSQKYNIIIQYDGNLQKNIRKYAILKLKQPAVPRFLQLNLLREESGRKQRKLQYIKNFKALLQSEEQSSKIHDIIKPNQNKFQEKIQEKPLQIIALNQESGQQLIYNFNVSQKQKLLQQQKLTKNCLPQQKKNNLKQETKVKEKGNQVKSPMAKVKSLGNLFEFQTKPAEKQFRNPHKRENPQQLLKKSPLQLSPNLLAPSKLQISSMSIQSSAMLEQSPTLARSTIYSVTFSSIPTQIIKIISQYAQNIANPKNRNKIMVLNLQNQSIIDDSLQLLFTTLFTKINKKSLKYLKLSDNKITDIGFVNLLKHISSASNVNMSGNMLTQGTLQILVKNRDKVTPLRILNLKGNKMGMNKGVKDKIAILSKMGIMIQM